MAFLFHTVSELGIEKVRITGGEPLLRGDIVDIVQSASINKNIKEIVLTTNGSLLKQFAQSLKDAGLTRVNISLDTLRREVFEKITQRDFFENVMDGVNASINVGLTPLKINTVLMKGINEEDIVPIAGLSLKYPVIVRFIELMPVGNDGFWKDHYMSFAEALDLIKRKYELSVGKGTKGEVADYYKIVGSEGKIGFITPVSQHFCATCNRIRITSTGKIYPCLFSKEIVDIWEAVKSQDSGEVVKLIKKSVKIKPAAHGAIEKDDKQFIENMKELGG
jgi:cyclic pyranopterin phosphate synthase